MSINTIARLYATRTMLVLLLGCSGTLVPAAFADTISATREQPVQYGGYLAWNSSEPYWFNQYVGVGVEQRELFALNQQNFTSNSQNPDALTSTNLVIGTQFSNRFMVSGNAGYLSWKANGISQTQQSARNSIYWGLSTRWRLNRRVALKAQWQQVNFQQKEHLLLMGIDVKLNF